MSSPPAELAEQERMVSRNDQQHLAFGGVGPQAADSGVGTAQAPRRVEDGAADTVARQRDWLRCRAPGPRV